MKDNVVSGIRSHRYASTSAVAVGLALVLSAVGCERKQGNDMSQTAPPSENPITPGGAPGLVPRISPAKPGPEVTTDTPGAPGAQMTGDRNGAGQPTAAGDRTGASEPMAAGEQANTPRKAEAKFKVASGYKLSGKAKLEEVANGVKVVVDLDDAPPGKKGIHVHEKPDCSDIPNKSMGEHFAPGAKAHGLPPNAARHLGDLGNIDIDKNGDAHFEFVAQNANLKPGDPMSFLNRAIVIHESSDKGAQPSGNSGKPIACAVIEKD
ncbi:MAG TPA: superoxide dismutase family protein [Polyangiaceae bacterium]|nr:superoxide dismutase family protein [Polyangiaceae bacterium]